MGAGANNMAEVRQYEQVESDVDGGSSGESGSVKLSEEEEEESAEDAVRRRRICIGAWCGGIFLALALYMGIMFWVGWTLVDIGHQRMNEQDPLMPPTKYPRNNNCAGCKEGHKTDAELADCAGPCYGLKFILEWERLSEEAGFKLVHFQSRKGPRGEPRVNLSAWWLPPPSDVGVDPRTAPRIVAMHGLGSNYNHCGVQATCFLLRQLGFGCLAPTVRDYGLSGKSQHPDTLSWGYDYPMDLLGAWDYAVNDLDGALGGALPSNKVGVMGFSKGALGVAIAFAMEPAIPAVWLDSGPYSGLHGMIDAVVRPYLGFATPLAAEPVWWGAKYFAQTPLDYYMPMPMLANCSRPQRGTALSQGLYDSDVPIGETSRLALLLAGLPECYSVTMYTPPEYCNTFTHHQEMWEFPDDTRKVLCEFWSRWLDLPESTCQRHLPSYQLWSPPGSMPGGTPPLPV